MRIGTGILLAAFAATACKDGPTTPKQVPVVSASLSDRATEEGQDKEDKQDKEERQTKPHFNLNIVLRGNGSGFVRFRQPGTNGTHIVHLRVRVRHLEPNTSYQLQRATDANLDGICTGTNWLTLGVGSMPQSIVTDEKGKGTANLFRDLSAVTPGSTFDIYFRVIRQDTKAVVLMSECYQFTVR